DRCHMIASALGEGLQVTFLPFAALVVGADAAVDGDFQILSQLKSLRNARYESPVLVPFLGIRNITLSDIPKRTPRQNNPESKHRTSSNQRESKPRSQPCRA